MATNAPLRATAATVLPGLMVLAAASSAQEPPVRMLPETTVTATRVERESFDLPVSIDTVDARTIREDRPMVNLSESLNAVPGIVVQNRQNYAQDLQISSRGFGARSTFGVRGLRLIADGIPATMPDGQGQAASFSLDTADRIEVLRGPFASMYGNASGGVIQIFTADGPPEPTVGARLYGGSYDTFKGTLQYGGQHGPLNANVSASYFRTDGYRDHSRARRDHAHAKLKFDGGTAGVFTLIADYLDQPETQDPLGLTAAQVAENPRQAPAVAFQFDTRKSVAQTQIGFVHDLKLGPSDQLQARVYAGDRQVTQFLAIPVAVQAAATHSGGVVDLDRGYGGAGLRWSHSFAPLNLDLHVGIDYERMSERRRGFINNLGVAGALKRDEDDTVDSTDLYAQAEWRPFERLLFMAGVRRSRVQFESQDFFITGNPANRDDSGSVQYERTSPVGGVVFDLSERIKIYGNIGKGFETPTFAELAYRPDGSSGLNFALRPSVSTHGEIGMKFLLGEKSRATIALYRVDVSDEIVVASASGGRTTFKNAGKTERNGAEIGWHGRLGYGFEGAVALSWIDATFVDAFTSGVPPVAVPSGNRLPGVPSRSYYGELIWRHAASGFHAGAEVRHNGRVYVDDLNSQSAAPYTIANVRIGFDQQSRRWRFSEFLRIDNVTDKKYIGSVIVADTNGRFYEPAPERNWLVGVSAQLSF